MVKVSVVFDGIYRFGVGGGLGQWFTSIERELPSGSVRCIRGMLFQVYMQKKIGGVFCRKFEISWIPVDHKLESAHLAAFRKRVTEGENNIVMAP